MKKSVVNVIPFLLLAFLSSIEYSYAKTGFTDDEINTSSCMECLTAPLLFCPSTYFGCPGDDLDPTNTGYPISIPGDLNCPDPIVSYVDSLITDEACLKKYHRIWTAQYHPDSANAKLYAQCIQTLYLEDDELPVISDCPSDITIQLNEECDSTAVWPVPSADDNCGILSFSSTNNPGDSFPSGITEVLYIAEDICGQQDSCSFTITVIGTCCLNMNISCPPDTTVCVNSDLDPVFTGYPMVIMADTTCADPILSYTDSLVSNNPDCLNGLIIDRYWYANDTSQNLVLDSCIQRITTNDTIAPEILNIPDDITIVVAGANCSTVVNWTEPEAIDSCGILTFDSNISNGSVFTEGVSTVAYVALDYCGNTAISSFMVTIECDTLCQSLPVIICPPDYYGCPQAMVPDPSQSGYAMASPGDSLCLNPIVTYSDSVISMGNCMGEIVMERIWTATDPNDPNLSSTCSQLISLEDNTPPSISNIPQDITLQGMGPNCMVPANWTEPVASDNCGIMSFSSNIPSGSLISEGLTVVVYTAIDSCGLISTGFFFITVECISSCSAQPIIVCPPNYWACPDGTIPDPSISGYAEAFPASIECGIPYLSYMDIIISTGPCPLSKIIERHWTATDPVDASLYSTCVQVISLEDIQSPNILYCPADITVTASNLTCDQAVSWNSPLATDNCGAPYLSSADAYGNPINNGQIFGQGTTQVIYTATDDCGNSSSCQFSVTVLCASSCTEPPVITCPSNPVICPGSSVSPSLLGWAYAEAAPNCPSPSVDYYDHIISTGPCYGEKIIHRNWTAYYPGQSTLSSSCVQTIQLKDDQAPVFTSCPSDITVDNSSVLVSWYPPQAIDNCSTVNLSSTHYSGSYFPVGTTQVIYTATDNCWNNSICSFYVTVLNPYIIDLECPDDLYLTCSSNGTAVADWETPAYNGICGNCDSPSDIAGFVYMGSLNGSNYYCSTTVQEWTDAQATCEQHGGYLASIGSQEENDFLAGLLSLQSAWIGLSDHTIEGQFEWVNGDALAYTNWHMGQPNNYNNSQDYVEMLNDGQWNDQYNHFSLEYIMEIPCNNVIQTGGPLPGTELSGGTYTVSYEVQDACGGYGSCSFNIFVDGSLSLECPDDMILKADVNGPGVIAFWQEPTVSTCCSDCPGQNNQTLQGFTYLGSLNGHDYYCSDTDSDWPSAKSTCEQLGGHLAIIETQEENDFITNLLNTQSVWIGLSDHITESVFEWVNGQTPSFTNWYPGQPNNYNDEQDYVELLYDGFWNDQFNHFSLKYILEIPNCVDLIQTSGPAQGSILPPGSSHTVSYLATDACGNSASCSFDIEVLTNTTTDYCESQGSNSTYYHIASVHFGQIANKTGDDGGYGDYTSICGSISQGNIFEIHLTPSILGQDLMYWRVWIDYNHDGDFYDLGEMVAYGAGLNTVSGLIAVPSFIPTGTTRMRIIMNPGAYPADPCGSYGVGETEDYCLLTWGTSGINADDDIEQRNQAVRLSEKSDSASENTIQLYPNPAVDEVNVYIQDRDKIKEIFLFDLNGKEIQHWVKNEINDLNTVKLYDLPSGVYLMHFIEENNNMTYRKLIVSK